MVNRRECDKAFLEERIPDYPRHDASPADAALGELLARSYHHLNQGLATSHMFGTPLGTVTNGGIWPSLNGTLVTFAPSLPLAEYEFTSPLLGFKKTAKGYSGWYAPAQAGRWEIEIRLPAGEASRLKTVDVNGVRRPLPSPIEGPIRFSGESAPGKPLQWEISDSCA